MPYAMKPFCCDPARVKGEPLIVSHCENSFAPELDLIRLATGAPHPCNPYLSEYSVRSPEIPDGEDSCRSHPQASSRYRIHAALNLITARSSRTAAAFSSPIRLATALKLSILTRAVILLLSMASQRRQVLLRKTAAFWSRIVAQQVWLGWMRYKRAPS
jgi:hypothetical protein